MPFEMPGVTKAHLTVCPNCGAPMALRPDAKFTKGGPVWHECPLRPLPDARVRELQTERPAPGVFSLPQWIDCQKNPNTRNTLRSVPTVS